jgi:hypothetical protein
VRSRSTGLDIRVADALYIAAMYSELVLAGAIEGLIGELRAS